MNDERDAEDVVQCWECGDAIPMPSEAYWFSEESAICLACATRRGGAYDPADERWVREPDTAALLDGQRAFG
ncbi:MAG: hypothetical protein OZ921_01210 [Sorangiineae bacterium]|nr:hypothetical protein [Polyangiaceae bacterium]MEB2321103.1 hypothetical protein [Sorangiineae bacterium]